MCVYIYISLSLPRFIQMYGYASMYVCVCIVEGSCNLRGNCNKARTMRYPP